MSFHDTFFDFLDAVTVGTNPLSLIGGGEGEQSDDATLQALRAALDTEPEGRLSDQFLLQVLQVTQGDIQQAAAFINDEFRRAGLEGIQETLARVLGTGGEVTDEEANPFAFIQQQVDLGVISPEQGQQAILAALGISGGEGGDPGISDFQQAQLDFQLRQFNAQESQRGVSNAFAAANAALQAGNFELALEQFEAGNFLATQASGRQDVDLASTVQGRQAGILQGAGSLELGAGDLLGNLVNTIGSLGLEQTRLGFDILRQPRNATAAFLLGLGTEDSVNFPQFNPELLGGINVGQIQGLIDEITSIATSVRQRADESTEISITDLLDFINQAGDTSAAGLEDVLEPEETSMTGPPVGDTITVGGEGETNSIIQQVIAPLLDPFFNPGGGQVIPGSAATGAPDPFDLGGFDQPVAPVQSEPEDDIEAFLAFLLEGA